MLMFDFSFFVFVVFVYCLVRLLFCQYTGEANAFAINGAEDYVCSFPAMIDDWRQKFHQKSMGETSLMFPFGFVQVLIIYIIEIVSFVFLVLLIFMKAKYYLMGQYNTQSYCDLLVEY